MGNSDFPHTKHLHAKYDAKIAMLMADEEKFPESARLRNEDPEITKHRLIFLHCSHMDEYHRVLSSINEVVEIDDIRPKFSDPAEFWHGYFLVIQHFYDTAESCRQKANTYLERLKDVRR